MRIIDICHEKDFIFENRNLLHTVCRQLVDPKCDPESSKTIAIKLIDFGVRVDESSGFDFDDDGDTIMHYLAKNCCYNPDDDSHYPDNSHYPGPTYQDLKNYRKVTRVNAKTLFDRTKLFINLFLEYEPNLLRTKNKHDHTPYDIASGEVYCCFEIGDYKQTEEFRNLFKCSK